MVHLVQPAAVVERVRMDEEDRPPGLAELLPVQGHVDVRGHGAPPIESGREYSVELPRRLHRRGVDQSSKPDARKLTGQEPAAVHQIAMDEDRALEPAHAYHLC